MIRALLAAAILCLVAPAVAEDSQPLTKVPFGVWAKSLEDGTVLTLSFKEKETFWVSQMPNRGTATLTGPPSQISGEGIVFGYMRSYSRTHGTESSSRTFVRPFAFKASINDDVLTVSELRFYGADAILHEDLEGSYRANPIEAAEPPASKSTK